LAGLALGLQIYLAANILGCSSQRWASVLSDLAQQFTFLWRRENAVKIT
jgi:hypothetical protein